MYAVVGTTARATSTLGWRVVEELLTRVTGDEIAFVVGDPEAVAGYRNRNVDIRHAAPDEPAATQHALRDAEVVVQLVEPPPDAADDELTREVTAAVDRAMAAVTSPPHEPDRPPIIVVGERRARGEDV